MNPLTSALATLAAGNGLSASESRVARSASLLDGEASDVVAAAFLTALRIERGDRRSSSRGPSPRSANG